MPCDDRQPESSHSVKSTHIYGVYVFICTIPISEISLGRQLRSYRIIEMRSTGKPSRCFPCHCCHCCHWLKFRQTNLFPKPAHMVRYVFAVKACRNLTNIRHGTPRTRYDRNRFKNSTRGEPLILVHRRFPLEITWSLSTACYLHYGQQLILR